MNSNQILNHNCLSNQEKASLYSSICPLCISTVQDSQMPNFTARFVSTTSSPIETMIEEPSNNGNIKQITFSIKNSGADIKDKIKNSKNFSSDDRSLHKGLAKIKEWSVILNFDEQVVDKAEEQYRKLETARDTFKGRSIEAIITAILYIASR